MSNKKTLWAGGTGNGTWASGEKSGEKGENVSNRDKIIEIANRDMAKYAKKTDAEIIKEIQATIDTSSNYKLKDTTPKKELFRSAEELERLAQERTRKAELKAMTPEIRAEHFASRKMFHTHLAKEYSK